MGAGASSAAGVGEGSASVQALLSALGTLNSKAQATPHEQITAARTRALAERLHVLAQLAEQLAAAQEAAAATEVSDSPAAAAHARSHAAVEAGIVAVSGRRVASQYVPHMERWAADTACALPKAILVSSDSAAVQDIGPCYVLKKKAKMEVEELEASLQRGDVVEVCAVSRLAYQARIARELFRKADAQLDAAVAHLYATRLSSASAISPGLASDAKKYGAAIHEMAANEVGVLEDLTAAAAEMANRGPLTTGEEVEVVVDGSMKRAQVGRVVDEAAGTYELSLWTEVSVIETEYEVGFNTSTPKLLVAARRDVYANRKQTQRLSAAALELASKRAAAEGSAASPPPSSTSKEYLALLYCDAERTLPALHELGADVQQRCSGATPLIAPLKGEARATYKALDKYRGDYGLLTDLARMTFECQTLTDALAALRLINDHEEFELLRIKNRLMLAFDASATGGYRDLLLNLRSKATGHVVEVQITLVSILAVKAGGGHANYTLARLHELFDRDTYRYEGALSAKLLLGVKCGIVRELLCEGKSTGLGAHFDELLAALRAPSCGLRELRLTGCDWPRGRAFSELLDALANVRTHLTTLVVERMDLGGEIPPAFFETCDELEFLAINHLKLTGPIPKTIGRLTKAETIMMWGNQLTGTIPDEVGDCCSLKRMLSFSFNQLTGEIPLALGRLSKIERIDVQNNKLTGKVPAEELRSGLPLLHTFLCHENNLDALVFCDEGEWFVVEGYEAAVNGTGRPTMKRIFC